jgi:iturin family lipopeptide synthetase B
VLLHFDEQLDTAMLEKIFRFLYEYHDALRITFRLEQEEVVQFNNGTAPGQLVNCYDLMVSAHAEKEMESLAGAIQAGIDLANGPLLSIARFRMKGGDRLLIVVHHLVVDGVSWRILMEDIGKLYHQCRQGEPLSLGPKSDSFKYWSERLQEYANSTNCTAQIPYWKHLEEQPISIIRERMDSCCLVKDSDTLVAELAPEQTGLLLTAANNRYHTQVSDLLLTALALSVHEVYNIGKVLINLEGHGRENIPDDMNVHRTVGWFTTLYPVVLDPGSSDETGKSIKTIKEGLRAIPEKGMGYGLLKYITRDELKKDLSFRLQPEITFNYLGQIDQDIDNASLQLSSEYQGANYCEYTNRISPVEISCIASGGRLVISFIYDRNLFSEKEIRFWQATFRGRLESIIMHCCDTDQEEKTPSDFTYKNLSMEELDSFFD